MMIVRRVFFVIGCVIASMGGAQVMSWYLEPYPVRVHHRHMLTPVIAEGDDVQIGLEVFRDLNCPIRVMRRFKWSDGSTTPFFQELDAGFGPLGPDDYTLRLATARNLPHGRAEVWSKSCSRCNPVQKLSQFFERCSPESIDRFVVGDETKRVPNPNGFEPEREVSPPVRN